MIKISLIVENASLELIMAFDRWIYLNKQEFPEISGQIITNSQFPKGFWRFQNIDDFIIKN